MSKPQKTEETESDWKKIGPCLYRYRGAKYYALMKVAGKQIRRSLETEDLPLARRRLADLRRDFETTDPTLGARTIEAHAERFEATLTGSESTLANDRHYLKNLLKKWPQDSPRVLAKIKKTDCEQFFARFDNLSASTINHMLTLIRRFFQSAVEDGVIPRNPMDGIKYRKLPKLTRLTPTSAQFEAIVADLRSQISNGHGRHDTADFVELAGRLGLGQAELSAIERQHINLEAGTIQVFRKKTREAFTIPIYPLARPIIERRLADMPAEPTARLLPHDDCKKGLAGACRRLQLPKFEPRSLRRHFITEALRLGIDAPTVAAWQGHRDGGKLVLSTYGDTVRMDHSLRMAQLLNPEAGNALRDGRKKGAQLTEGMEAA